MVEETAKYHLRLLNDRGRTLDLRSISKMPVVVVGTSAERPKAGIAGRVFYETDTGTSYVDDGLTWNGFGGGAGSLTDLSDVGTVSYTAGQVLRADGVDYDSDVLHHTDLDTISAGDHHAQDQSANYKDGGGFEIDAAEFAGGLGTAGQYLKTDGAAASWVSPPGIVRSVNFQVSRVTLGDGETHVLGRFTAPAGKIVKIWKAQVANSAGNSVTGLTIECYNNTDAVSIYSTNGATVQEGSPLASGGTGDDVEVRISNASGGTVDCQGFMLTTLE